MTRIIFNNDLKTKKFVLSLFNNSIDDEGLIVDSKGEKIIDSDGQEIMISQLGTIKKGSQIYVKNSLPSLVNFYRKYLNKT